MTKPPLYGLVLAGGLSTRMGTDKGLLVYYHKPHREHLADLLKPYCERVYISINQQQSLQNNNKSYEYFTDHYQHIGPMGGILTAFELQPNIAWFVLACDFTHLTYKSLESIIQQRNPQKFATIALNTTTQHIEPLFGIYEPAILQTLRQAYKQQNFSITRVLHSSRQYEAVHLHNPTELLNINSPITPHDLC